MDKVLLMAILLISSVCPVWADSLLLQNAKVVDPKTKSVTTRNILILDGRIANSQEQKKGVTYRTIDLAGKWIIPGLIDLHVHCGGNPLANDGYEDLGPEKTARVMLYSGVCAYLDLFYGNFAQIFRVRNLQRTEPNLHHDEADIYCAGMAFGKWNLKADPKAEVESYIDRWKPDVIKLIYGRGTLDRQTLAKAIKGAQSQHLKTVVHIGSWEHAQDAIESGATAVTHFFDDEVIPAPVLRAWAKTKTISIPTMAVQTDMANFVAKPTVLKSRLLAQIEPATSVYTYLDKRHYSKKAKETLQWQQEDLKNNFESFRKLAKANVPILAGSDTGNLGTFQGFSLHREIKIMQDAGFSTWDALASATTKAADFLGRPSGMKVGDIAELVVLDADPIADIANTQKISAVVHHGCLVDRSTILKR